MNTNIDIYIYLLNDCSTSDLAKSNLVVSSTAHAHCLLIIKLYREIKQYNTIKEINKQKEKKRKEDMTPKVINKKQ